MEADTGFNRRQRRVLAPRGVRREGLPVRQPVTELSRNEKSLTFAAAARSAFRTASDGLFWKSSLCGVTKGTLKGGELSRVGTTNTIPYGENATSVRSPSRSVLNFTLRLFKLAIYVNKQARKHPHRDRLC